MGGLVKKALSKLFEEVLLKRVYIGIGIETIQTRRKPICHSAL